MGYGSPEGNWLDVGVGIASGEEYVGNVGGGGFKDFTAMGDVTNTAARLQSLANGGEILVTQETYRVVIDAYPKARREVLALRGKQSSVEAFRITVG